MFSKCVRWASCLVLAGAAQACACPMCVEALLGDSNYGGNLPLAFYYSILFMLSMPFLIVAAFSVYFYILSKPGKPTEALASPVTANSAAAAG